MFPFAGCSHIGKSGHVAEVANQGGCAPGSEFAECAAFAFSVALTDRLVFSEVVDCFASVFKRKRQRSG